MGGTLGYLLGPRAGAWRLLGASTAANEKSNVTDLQNLTFIILILFPSGWERSLACIVA